MANKRMFSKQITESDAFLDMPISSQLLYFHLNMGADDDGFVANPKRIMRVVGVQDDDLKILLAKRFLLAFKSGVVVIKHWLLHNAVRKDMYQETQYLEEKKQLEIKENKVYTESRNESVTNPSHRIDKIRLDKDRLDKISISEQSSQGKLIGELIYEFRKVNPSYEKFYANKTQRSALQRLLDKYGEKKVRGFIEYLPIINEDKYAKGKSMTPLQLEDNLGHIINHYKQKKKGGVVDLNE